MQNSIFKLKVLKWIFYITSILIFLSFSNASRLWGILKKENKPLIHDYEIIYKQLRELQIQGNLGNFADWPYNSDDGWGLVKYSNLSLEPDVDIFNSPIPAINDPEFINSINSILEYDEDTRIALGHVRKSTSGSFSIPNPHPFNFNHLNRTYSFAHNGTIDKTGLMSLLTNNGIDSSWIRLNPPDSYNCGNWESIGFDCIVDSELYFLWLMKNIIESGDDLRGIINAIQILETTEFQIDEFYGEQRNFVFSNGLELFAYKSADNISGEFRHKLFYRSYENHFSIMSTPFSVDSGYISLENHELLILSDNLNSPISIKTDYEANSTLDNQILQDIININELDETNCLACNNNATLEPFELGFQLWENNHLIQLDLSNYSNEQLKFYPSSIRLLSNLIQFNGPTDDVIPKLYCNDLPAVISSQIQCDELGCTDPNSCNYNSFATIDNGFCEYPELNNDCDNNCVFDLNEDGVCDIIENIGCSDTLGINYNPEATINEHCFYDNILLLKKGNNLISFPGELANNSTIELLTHLSNQQLEVNFVLGQGVGIFNINNEWSGNLHNLNIKNGYWINTQTNFAWHIPLATQPLLQNECINYSINEGNNLISYTGPVNNSTINALNGEEFSNNFEFILGQSVGLFNTEQGWTGNLYNLHRKKGYWLNSLYPMDFYWGTECGESLILDSLNKVNSIFKVNQSTNQSFYLIKEIKINDESPQIGDLILAFHNEEIIGSVNFSDELLVLPIMGKDISEQTISYIEEGQIPNLKLYKRSTGEIIDLKGLIPKFENQSVYHIDLLKSNEKSIPNKIEIQPIYPNPFNASTTLKFSIPKKSRVLIEFFDIKGQKIKTLIDETLNDGNHQLKIEMTSIPSGIYFINTKIFEQDFKYSFKNSQKMLLIK